MSRKLFRRRASYSETWAFDQVVIGDSIIDLGVGECTESELIDVDDEEETSPDDLNEEEARTVAKDLATGAEREQLDQMGAAEMRVWIKKKLKEHE